MDTQFTSPTTAIMVRPYQAPCGDLLLGSYADALCLCDWQQGRRHERTVRRLLALLHTQVEQGETPLTRLAAAQLDSYFAGTRQTFDMPLLLVGTEFQKNVWNALLHIPYGQTISYGGLADRLGRPSAVRAVANANAANALSVIAPCHRVVGAGNALTGYAGGLEAKRFLLDWERRNV